MQYRIILREGEDGYVVAQCLEVPGAISQGKTREEALKNVKEALALLLEVLEEDSKSGDIVRVQLNA